MPSKIPVSFVLIDNSHLGEHGIKYFVLITTNKNHPAFHVKAENMGIIFQEELSLKKALIELKDKYNCERITIQSGGTMNGIFLREKLIDFVDIVVAPVLIGGKETFTLIDGKSITSIDELNKLAVLKHEDSYVRLGYKVNNS